MQELTKMKLVELAKLVKKKEISPVEIVEQLLTRIDAHNSNNNAYVTVRVEEAINEAKIAEKEILNGLYKGALHGIPISVKDNISVQNTRLTNGSRIYDDNVSKFDAPVVAHLKSSGSIIIGKTNLDEFANNVTGLNENYGFIKNPRNEQFSSGGSSGGSAVSVADHLAYGSLGTDTSGSVRIPASCCGIVSLKPTYNLLPTTEVYPLSWSLDHVGLLAKDCTDLYQLYNGVTLHAGAKGELEYELKDKIVGIFDRSLLGNVNAEVEQNYQQVIEKLEDNGALIKYVTVPSLEDSLNILELIIGYEAAYLHRENLMKYQSSYDKGNYSYLQEALTITKEEYQHALFQARLINDQMRLVFNDVDVMITPTLPITVPDNTVEEIHWKYTTEDVLSAMSRYTGPFNVSGLPAVSIPMGFSANGLPIGLQVVGNMYSETDLIAIGNTISQMINIKTL